MLLLMGAQLIAAGLIGELLIRVYHEAGGAPQFHATEVLRDEQANQARAPAPPAPTATV